MSTGHPTGDFLASICLIIFSINQIAKKDLINSLKDELSGDLEYALLTLGKTWMNPIQQTMLDNVFCFLMCRLLFSFNLVFSIQSEGIPYSCNYLKQRLGNPTAFITSLSHRAEVLQLNTNNIIYMGRICDSYSNWVTAVRKNFPLTRFRPSVDVFSMLAPARPV